MPRTDPQLSDVFTTSDAVAAGLSEAQVHRRGVSRTWRRLRRGVYCLASTWEQADRNERFRIDSHAAYRAVRGHVVMSHASAAAVLDLPVPTKPTAWLTAPSGSSPRYLDGLVIEAASVPDVDIWDLEGVAVTSLGRTVVDCLRHLELVDAVAIADAAARRDPHLRHSVQRVLEYSAAWPYADRARSRLALVDGRRESYAESWSYVLMHELGLPLPEPQVVVTAPDGSFVARVDALWDGQLVGEVDGVVKYGVGTNLSLDAARLAVVEEKRREDALRALGLDVVRWGTRDLQRPREWAEMIRTRLRTVRRDPVLATLTHSPYLRLDAA